LTKQNGNRFFLLYHVTQCINKKVQFKVYYCAVFHGKYDPEEDFSKLETYMNLC